MFNIGKKIYLLVKIDNKLSWLFWCRGIVRYLSGNILKCLFKNTCCLVSTDQVCIDHNYCRHWADTGVSIVTLQLI